MGGGREGKKKNDRNEARSDVPSLEGPRQRQTRRNRVTEINPEPDMCTETLNALVSSFTTIACTAIVIRAKRQDRQRRWANGRARAATTMQLPRIEREDQTCYFVDAQGVRWRVHDCCFGPPFARPGHRKRLPLEAPGTNTRYFINAEGDERAYTLTWGESRRLTPADCTRQFAESGYCWKETHDRPPTHPS